MITEIVKATKIGVQLATFIGVATLVGWEVRAIKPSTSTTVQKVVTVGSATILACWVDKKLVDYVDDGFADLEEWAKAKDENHKDKKEAKKAAKELKKVTKERA